MFKLGSFVMTPAKHQAFMAAAAAGIVYTKSPLVMTGAASVLGSCWALVQCMNRPVSVRVTPAGAHPDFGASGSASAPGVAAAPAGAPQDAAFSPPPPPPPQQQQPATA